MTIKAGELRRKGRGKLHLVVEARDERIGITACGRTVDACVADVGFGGQVGLLYRGEWLECQACRRALERRATVSAVVASTATPVTFSLLPLDVGHDVRATRMPTRIAASDEPVAIAALNRADVPVLVAGRVEHVAAQLGTYGYRVQVVPEVPACRPSAR